MLNFNLSFNFDMDPIVEKGLQTLGIVDNDLAAYMAGILSDDDTTHDERRELFTELLAEHSTDTEGVERVVTRLLDERDAYRVNLKAEEQLAREHAFQQLQHSERLELVTDAIQVVEEREMDRDEYKKRQHLLQRFGYDLDDVVEGEDGELEIRYLDRSNKVKSEVAVLANRNTQVVKDAELRRRELMKNEHDKKVQRDKEQLEKQRLQKEKEKVRTQKKEKRRM
jgi:hypothetical protein